MFILNDLKKIIFAKEYAIYYIKPEGFFPFHCISTGINNFLNENCVTSNPGHANIIVRVREDDRFKRHCCEISVDLNNPMFPLEIS